MLTVNSVKDYRRIRRIVKDRSVGYVPTMGALHSGHLRLVEHAIAECEVVVVSIFLNPIQFSLSEDLDSYPRTLESDLSALQALDPDIVLVPPVSEIFPGGERLPKECAATVSVQRLSAVLCGRTRPSHFDGVTTEMMKLMWVVLPDVLYLGEKDFQQLVVLRKLCEEFLMPVRVRSVATVREADGLAMSSRNQYLSPGERVLAPMLNRVLRDVAKQCASGQPFEVARSVAVDQLTNEGFQVEYLEWLDAATLEPATPSSRESRVFGAVHLGRTRLIDNEVVA